jgi:hypothetical protein
MAMTKIITFKNAHPQIHGFPLGSDGWVEGMSIRLQNIFSHVEEYGIEKLISGLKALMPHRPWERIPLGRPSRRADVYFEGITGKHWSVLEKIIEPYDAALAMMIASYCNPGRGARSDLIEYRDRTKSAEKAEQGHSRTYTLNRLRRDAPELFDAVVAGQLSPNAAAIKAGFRRKTTPLEFLMPNWRKASDEERAAFRDFITQLESEPVGARTAEGAVESELVFLNRRN